MFLNRTSLVLILVNLLAFDAGLVTLKPKQTVAIQQTTVTDHPVSSPQQLNFKITKPVPGHLSYDQTVKQLSDWSNEASIISPTVYGKSSKGKDLVAACITNPAVPVEKKKSVLITACIHGNEPLASSAVMGYIGTILDRYGDDPVITELVDTRVLYFVPVVNPDSYPDSRYVDGVDPNRNFPTVNEPNKVSVKSVEELKKLFLQIKPEAVWSGHTSGRVFLTPWGDRTTACPHEADFQRIVGGMGRMSGYRVIRVCQLYGRPIFGTENDWYYKNGAFAIVCEYGTIQRPATQQEVQTEFDKTFQAFLKFLKEAPEVKIRQTQL
jgi:hypothetical protein